MYAHRLEVFSTALRHLHILHAVNTEGLKDNFIKLRHKYKKTTHEMFAIHKSSYTLPTGCNGCQAVSVFEHEI